MSRRLLLLPALLLVWAFILVSALGAAPSRAPLPPIPASVWSVYGPVPVLRQHPTDCGTTGAIGCYQRLRRRIIVDDSLELVTAHRVLEHERFHLMVFDQNAGFSSPQDEQTAANVYANYRVAELLAGNP